MKKKINDILDQQEFEVNEPPLNREEIVNKIISLFEKESLESFELGAIRGIRDVISMLNKEVYKRRKQ